MEVIKRCVEIIKEAKKPIVIIGKGAAYCRSEKKIKEFVEKNSLCFIPMPMAKGVISDEHRLCVSGARSYAFRNCDLVVVLGARFNWMLDYGHMFKSKQVIHVDVNKDNLIKAQLVYKEKRVLAILGDSAFGFSMNEVETIKRYKLPIIILIINNAGIYYGLEEKEFNVLSTNQLPSFALTPQTRYERMASMVGCKGYFVTNKNELELGLRNAFASNEMCIINCVVDPKAETKEFYKLPSKV